MFYPKTNASKGSIDWLEYEAEKRNLHVHHALCGHGGERGLQEHLWMVTNRQPRFQYHGCHFHGCSAHCKQDNTRELFQKTRQQEEKIKNAGYNLVAVWECKAPGYKDITHEQKIVIYPHAIVYDFEACLDKAKKYIVQQKTSHSKTCTCQSQFP